MVVSKYRFTLKRKVYFSNPPVQFTGTVCTADHTGFFANNTISSNQEYAFKAEGDEKVWHNSTGVSCR